MKECWTSLNGVVPEGHGYHISNLGRVWSDKTNRVLKHAYGNGGYPFVSLSKESRIKSYDIHRMMAIAFLGEPKSDKMEVNHKDGNKTNNKISNLEWVTRSENKRHAYRIGLRNPLPSSNTKKATEANRKPVAKFDVSNDNIVGVYQSASVLIRLGSETKRSTISYQCNNKSMPVKQKYYHRFATGKQVEEAISGGYYFEETN